MRTLNRMGRLGRLLAATALVAPAFGGPVQAQTTADPPWRVGRLARIDGSVSTHGAGATDWTDAVINTPLTSGDGLWTQPGADAEVGLAGSVIFLSEATELDLATLDNQQFIATEPQGELFLDLRASAPGDTYSITTPRGVVALSGAGQYDIVAGSDTAPTLISVVAGAAQIQSGSFLLRVGAGQTATVTGSDALGGSIGPLVRDAFLSARLARPVGPPAGPTEVRYMTGAESLASYGSWRSQPQYGQVWYPQVATGWAPYRDGSWSYVQPWGWTWVDSEPWGFAPFHYGRWSQFGGRWGWVPGEPGAPPDAYAQPAYAPALVDFVAAGAVAGAVAGLAVAAFDHGGPGGNVGWIPLGPHENYQPPFHVGPTYLQRVNYGRIDNIHVNNTTIINNFSNRDALTVVPASAMARSEQVRAIARTGVGAFGPAGPGGQSDAHVLRGALPMRPDASTRGITPVAAHAFGISAVAHPAAPGPAIDQALFHPHELPASRTPFRTAGGQGRADVQSGPHPGAPGVPPGQGAGRPPGFEPHAGPGAVPVRPGLPPLRAQGAVPPGIEASHDARPSGAPPVPGHPDQAGGTPGDAAHAARRDGQDRASGARPDERPPAARLEPAQREQAHPEPARPAPPRPEAIHRARPGAAEAHPDQRPEAPHAEAPRPEPRPAPQRAEEPRMAPPRAEPPRSEPPRAQPAPRPVPARAEPPREAPHPAPAPHSGPGPRDDRPHS